jgi:glucan phosphoethanolaminetransferase (alkaline phosphatase superfamily)
MINNIKTIIAVVLGLVVGCISLWCYWVFYIKQLIHPSFEVTGDPFYIMSVLLGGSLSVFGLMAIQPFIHIKLWIEKRRIALLKDLVNPKQTIRVIVITAIFGGSFAFVSNIFLLHKVIPDHGYVLCPKKVGYKKNLLRDYVLDINQCERF